MAFGGVPRVHQYWDESESRSVDILSCEDRPEPGYVTYSTVGLHRVPNLLDGRDVRVEMACVCTADRPEVANALATSAFYVLKDGWLCAPGVVFPEMLSTYDLPKPLPHLMWVEPFPWEELGSVQLAPNSKVHWMLGIPISDEEREFLETVGFYELERRMAIQETPYFDLNRPSIV